MPFTKDKHIRYWRMCAQSLPHHYTSNDASRMTLGFFTISALDLLGALDTIDQEERRGWVEWIYSCQVPEGGFRGFTGTDLRSMRSDSNNHWDPANLPATFFALATLLVLGDDLSRVKRQECLAWLPLLQRLDGSFGELLSKHGNIEGDQDLRQCCCAAGIAYMLQGHRQRQPAFNESRLMQYIQSCQSREGGFGVSPLREPHSGLSYCAVAALAFLRRLEGCDSTQAIRDIPAVDRCVKWFVDRQTNVIDDENDEESDNGAEEDDLSVDISSLKLAGPSATPLDNRIAGFNGRDGKIADTCYSFWNVGALAILGRESLVDSDAMRLYLLDVTQHHIGGFGKTRGEPPDVLHSYLGLATLSVFGESDIKPLDPTMCVSVASAANLDRVSWKRST